MCQRLDIRENESLTSVASTTNVSVMLQTASVKVKAQAQSRYQNCRLLFDNCSQLSYITPELCEKLNLQSIGIY